MAEHQWVKMTITPVNIDKEGDVTIRETQLQLADEQSVYGCGICDEPYTMNSTQECMGRKADADVPPL